MLPTPGGNDLGRPGGRRWRRGTPSLAAGHFPTHTASAPDRLRYSAGYHGHHVRGMVVTEPQPQDLFILVAGVAAVTATAGSPHPLTLQVSWMAARPGVRSGSMRSDIKRTGSQPVQLPFQLRHPLIYLGIDTDPLLP